MEERASVDTLGNINLNFIDPIFPPIVLNVPNLDAILQEVPKEARLQITRALQAKMDENN